MNSIIVCKNCGIEIEVSEALSHQVQEDVKKALEKDFKKEIELEKEKLLKEMTDKQGIELQDLKKELEEKSKKVVEFREQELKLREEKRKMEEERKEMEVSIARKLDEQSKLLTEKIAKETEDKFHLKDKEKEMQIENLKRMLEEANRKASGVSQQVQGEVLEQDLEDKLRQTFPTDEITAVGKGVRGGDIVHTVKNKIGQSVGVILWETKRAAWSPGWLSKLREDVRKEGASLSVLVSEDLPKEIKTFGVIEGVLVTDYSYVIPLSFILRRQLIAISQAKQSVAHKDETLEMIYQYLQSDSFRHRIEEYVEGIIEMKSDLDSEMRSMERIWKKREMQIKKAEINIAKLYGELQGIMGNSLPDIKILSLDSGNSED